MKKTSKQLGFVVLLLTFVAVNFIAVSWHKRFDLTQEKRYSLSAATKDLLYGLNDQLTIYVFLKGDLPADFRRLSNATEDFVRTLRETNSSKVRYKFINPDDEVISGKTWGDSLKAMGILPINLSVQVKSGQEFKYAYPAALINYKGQAISFYLVEKQQRASSMIEINNAEALLEYRFAKNISQLINNQKQLIGYAVGNGEPTDATAFALRYAIDPESVPKDIINPTYFDVAAKSNYALGLFNLKDQKAIPDTFKAMLITKPTEPFTEDEKLKLDQYIMRGGKVLWFLDVLHAEQDSLSYKSQLIAYNRNLNIQDLLFSYGVRINPDLIMDLQCDYLPFAVGGTPQQPQYEFLKWNYYPLFESRNNHPINKNLGLVAGKFVNSIDTIETAGLRKTYLLQSSNNSRTISTPVLISPNENRNAPEDALFKKTGIPAGVIVEGKFTSFYKNRIGRATIDSLQALGGYREESMPNKMIVVADGDILLNQVSSRLGPLPMGMNLFTLGSQYEYQFANRDFLLNCLEYLTSSNTIAESRNKEIVLRLLDNKKVEAEKSQWQLINIALPIAFIILFGVIYQQGRKRKYASA
ncbi:MAG: gliding motility-associated ABC transporter substrate-binding protein GldG [Chitinophagaceae bacterium]